MLSLIFTLVVIGVLLYCVNRFVPIEQNIKNIINIVVIVCVIIFLLNQFGVLSGMRNVPVPQLK